MLRRVRVEPRWYLAHPVLVAAYPVIFLFAQNASEQMSLEPLWLPLAISLAITLVLAGVLTIVIGDALTAGLLVTLLLLVTFGYGHAWNLTEPLLGSEAWLLAIAAGVLSLGAIAIAFIARRRERAVRVSQALTLLAAVGVLANGASAGSQLALNPTDIRPGTAAARELGADVPTERPDIYYIILDRYARADVLADIHGYDNRPFLDALAERGFYIADESYANYLRTPLSLVSSLSMDYLDGAELRSEAESPGGGNPIDELMRGHLAVPQFLKQLGYRYIHIGSEWQPSATNVDADVTLRYRGFPQFASAVFETTIFGALTPAHPAAPFSAASMRAHALYQFDQLEGVADAAGPKYVFAHILVPHPPYVFDRDGSLPTEAELAARGNDESYVRQVEYANERILGTVDDLLAGDRDPVIILQADEGPWPRRFRIEYEEFQWRSATRDELREKMGILNAYRLPGDVEKTLYPHISPVNSFRVVLNAYFGADLPLLADRQYAHTDAHHFYDFFEVTDRLAN